MMKVLVSIIVIIFISKIMLDIFIDSPSQNHHGRMAAVHDRYVRVRDSNLKK